jgi:hypothetical protein
MANKFDNKRKKSENANKKATVVEKIAMLNSRERDCTETQTPSIFVPKEKILINLI